MRNITDAVRLDLGLPKEASAGYLEAIQVSYHINQAAILQDVSLHLNGGEVVAIVGPNGAGKSTLLSILCGDLRPTSGEVALEGLALGLYPPPDLALKRAVMRQRAALTAEFTVRDVVMMGRYPHQRFGVREDDSPNDSAIVEAALARTETSHLAGRLYPTLSGGEQARVTFSRVLAQQTPLLLLDEPTAALDLRHQQIVMDIARERAEAGAAVLMIVHDLNLAAAHADRVVMLHAGQVYADGSPAEVLTPQSVQAVFNLPVIVMDHPQPPRAPCPLIIPLHPDVG